MDKHNKTNLIKNFNDINIHLYGLRELWNDPTDSDIKQHDEIKQLFLDEWIIHILLHDIYLALLQKKPNEARRLKKKLLDRARTTIDNVDEILQHEGNYLKCCNTMKHRIDAISTWVQ
tara:strand:+ start:898 stop:1251 length:354 start_codon:yes stop_codon:yes gene_type:complete